MTVWITVLLAVTVLIKRASAVGGLFNCTGLDRAICCLSVNCPFLLFDSSVMDRYFRGEDIRFSQRDENTLPCSLSGIGF